MAAERKVLEVLIKYDMFPIDDPTVTGIALKALATGFHHLTESEEDVLEPFMTMECEGVVNPGGHHNNCQKVLEDEELVAAVQQHSHYGAALCGTCRNEADDYRRAWERTEAE